MGKNKKIIVFPELLGGVSIPREPAGITGGTEGAYWLEKLKWFKK